jgi:hypothetical protein
MPVAIMRLQKEMNKKFLRKMYRFAEQLGNTLADIL